MINYYEFIGVYDRSISISEIKEKIDKKILDIEEYNSVINDDDEAEKELKKQREMINQAKEILCGDPSKKAEYDKELEIFLKDNTPEIEDTSKAEDYLSKAQFFFESANYEYAIKSCMNAITENDEFIEAYVLMGRIFFAREDYQSAVNAINKALSSQNNDRMLLLHSARYYIFLQDSENAQKRINELLILNPSDPLAMAEQNYLYLMFDREDLACEKTLAYFYEHPEDKEFSAASAKNFSKYAATFFSIATDWGDDEGDTDDNEPIKFEEDNDKGEMILIGKEAYKEAKKYTEIACRLNNSPVYLTQMERINAFGEKIMIPLELGEVVYALIFIAALFYFFGILVGIIAVLPIILLIFFSRMPMYVICEINYANKYGSIPYMICLFIVMAEGAVVKFSIALIKSLIEFVRELVG